MILPLFTALVVGPQGALSVPQVLSEVRKAVHYEAYAAHPTGLRFRGPAHSWGTDGAYTLLQASDGRYAIQYSMPKLAKLPSKSAFDGRTYWSSDWSGAPITSDPASGCERAMTLEAQTHGWLNPARGYTVTLGASTEKEVDLNLASKDGFALATVKVDRVSWLPRTLTVLNPSGPITVTLSDYRSEQGVLIPHDVTDERSGVKESRTVESVDEIPAGPNEFSMPAWQPSDVSFDSSRGPDLRSVRGPNGHLIVYAAVGGKEGWFIFDSGASIMVIDQKFADEANLGKVGEISLSGIGGVVKMHYRPVPEFRLGPVTLKDALFSEYDLSALGDAFGVKVSGIVGYDIFRRTVAEVDLSSNHVRLFDPAAYKLERGSWQPLSFSRRSPYVIASFGKQSGPFRLDSGAATNVIFHTPAVKRYGLGLGQKLEPTGLGGIGGSVSAGIGTIESFTLGGKTFKNPSVTFAQSETGLVADRFLVGNIGQPFMEPFRIVYDYTHSRIAFLPR